MGGHTPGQFVLGYVTSSIASGAVASTVFAATGPSARSYSSEEIYSVSDYKKRGDTAMDAVNRSSHPAIV